MAVLDRSLENLLRLPRGKKQGLMVLTDLVMLPLALWLAFVIRSGQPVPPMMVEAWWLFALVPAVGVLVFVRLGLYRTVVRFMGARAIRSVIVGGLCTRVDDLGLRRADADARFLRGGRGELRAAGICPGRGGPFSGTQLVPGRIRRAFR